MSFLRKEPAPDISEMTDEEKREHRERILSELINSYASKEEDWIDESNPFRDKTTAEKAKKNLKMLGIRVLAGGAAAGLTVLLGGVPLVVAGLTVGGGLAASYLGRFGVDAVRHFGGAETKENDLRGELAVSFGEKEKKLAQLAKICKDAEVGIADDQGNIVAPELARLNFINYVTEISDPESSENRSFDEKKRKLISSQKNWAWVKAGAAIMTGVFAGGTIAELMHGALEHAIKEAGFQMSSHGLGKVAEYSSELKSNVHLVKEITHGDHSDVVFGYQPGGPGEVDKIGEVARIRDAVQSHPTELAGQFDSTAHATELANMNLHETGSELAANFQTEVTSRVSERSVELTVAALGAVASSELVDYLSVGRETYAGDADTREDHENSKEVSKEPGEFKHDQLIALNSRMYAEAVAGIPDMVQPGSERELLDAYSPLYRSEEPGSAEVENYHFYAGQKFKFLGIQSNGSFLLEPISDELNNRADRGQFAIEREEYIRLFVPSQPSILESFGDDEEDKDSISDKDLLENLAEIEIKEIISKLKFSNSEINGRRLDLELIEKCDLAPKYRLEIEGKEIWVSSNQFTFTGKLAGLAYIKQGEDYSPAPYMMSSSQGTFRFYPGFQVEAYGGTEDITWFSKGNGEESLALPIKMQKELARLSQSSVKVSHDDALVILIGSSNRYDTDTQAIIEGAEFSGVNKTPESINGIGNELLNAMPNPESLIISEEDEPDFNNVVSEWRSNNSTYGEVTYNVYLSHNGSLRYMFCRDQKDRAWISHIEIVDNKINDNGLNNRWIHSGALTTPAFEYPDQLGQFANGNIKSGLYVDGYEKFVSKIPVVQKFRASLISENEPKPADKEERKNLDGRDIRFLDETWSAADLVCEPFLANDTDISRVSSDQVSAFHEWAKSLFERGKPYLLRVREDSEFREVDESGKNVKVTALRRPGDNYMVTFEYNLSENTASILIKDKVGDDVLRTQVEGGEDTSYFFDNEWHRYEKTNLSDESGSADQVENKAEKKPLNFEGVLDRGSVWKVPNSASKTVITIDGNYYTVDPAIDYEIQKVEPDQKNRYFKVTVRPKGSDSSKDFVVSLTNFEAVLLPQDYSELRGEELRQTFIKLHEWTSEYRKRFVNERSEDKNQLSESEEPKTLPPIEERKALPPARDAVDANPELTANANEKLARDGLAIGEAETKALPSHREEIGAEGITLEAGDKKIDIAPGQRWSWKTASGEKEKQGKFTIENVSKNDDMLEVKFKDFPSVIRPFKEWQGIFEAGRLIINNDNFPSYKFKGGERNIEIHPRQTWLFHIDGEDSLYDIERISSAGEDEHLRIKFVDHQAKVRPADEWRQIFEAAKLIK